MKKQEMNSEFYKRKRLNVKKHRRLNNYIILYTLSAIFGLNSISSNAQKTWSLANCIDYALENNITLQKAENTIQLYKTSYNESKAQILPSLNIGSNLNMSFGRTIDGSTNEITFDQTLSNNYSLNSSIDLFQGLVKYNTIRYNKYLLAASKEDAAYTKNKLVMDILSSYYLVLYSQGLKNVAKSQVTLSEKQYKRMLTFVEIGRESQLVSQELKSQSASDQLQFVQAQNNYNKALLELKQLLRLDAQQDFEIDTLNQNSMALMTIQNIDSLFTIASGILPEIKQKEYLHQASIKELAIAKGSISPRIYLSAGLFTGYFDGDPRSFQNQISNNQNQGISLGISVPIFNNCYLSSNIKRKKITLLNRNLDLQKQKDVLYAEIWKVFDELKAAENEYQSAVELYGFSKLTLENATKKLEKGLASSNDYEIAKQRFTSAKASLLKAKLIYSMRKQILVFYKTGSWNHLSLNSK